MSIRMRLRLMMLSVTALTAIVIGISLLYVKETRLDAASINIAGSLRMQTWRIAQLISTDQAIDNARLAVLISKFHESIQSPELVSIKDQQSSSGTSYREVVDTWDHGLKIQLDLGEYGRFIETVPGFVDSIDRLVSNLQWHAEYELNRLYLAMLVALAGLVVISLCAYRGIKRHVLEPVQQLVQATDKIRQGQFTIAIPYQHENELGHLTSVFTEMANTLRCYYSELEQQVSRQTQALSLSNAVLGLLYQCSQTLGNTAGQQYSLQQHNLEVYLRRWQALLAFEQCGVCQGSETDQQQFCLIASVGVDIVPSQQECAENGCATCVASCGAARVEFPITSSGGRHQYGKFWVVVGDGQVVTDEMCKWLGLFADVLGKAQGQQRKREQERRILLMEERAVIARELHDSLAQSLSYQKIQISRLQRFLPTTDDSIKARQIVDELQDATNDAYCHLRELLVTFRLGMGDGSLKENIERTLEGVSKQAEHIQFTMEYDTSLSFQPLEAHQEIHILQVIREALGNVVKHSGASHCHVYCEVNGAGELWISVTDDGVGYYPDRERTGHYGLSIMRERASAMDGRIEFLAAESGGVQVLLRCPVSCGVELVKESAA